MQGLSSDILLRRLLFGAMSGHLESVMPSDTAANPTATPDKHVPAPAPQTEPLGPDADKDEPAPHERPPVRSDDN